MVHHAAPRPRDLDVAPPDTIAAVATPPGRGGVGIVRVSGPEVPDIARAVLGRLPQPRYAEYLAFRDASGEILDRGVALYFAAPHSFTGEDVLELQGHGGPVVMDLLLRRVVGLGARLARPGEFTERAFLNDKLDLAQAEAVADLIASSSEAAARGAMRSLEGEFSGRVYALTEALISLRTYLEACLDFPEDEIDLMSEGGVRQRLAGLVAQVQQLLSSAIQGSLLREGMTVVIAGPPNSGKSTLLNRLAQREAAIVTPTPGTTRDVLRELVFIDGMPVHVMDTAGLRDTDDPVEHEGVRRAWQELARADRILFLVDDRHGLGPEEEKLIARLPQGPGRTLIYNKIDLSGRAAGLSDGDRGAELALSAHTGAGVDLLRQHLKACMGYEGGGEGVFTARRRHLEALSHASRALEAALAQSEQGGMPELVAEDLRMTQQALGEITGEVSTEELLGRIFSEFCIGK